MYLDDTIAAIATPCGEGGIAVIRISGPQSLVVAEGCFVGTAKSWKGFSDVATHTVHHGMIKREGILVDEVLVTVFREPHSYTGEDSVEISCHGGYCIARQVLETVLDGGARMAEPGEFTRRAFLNGRLDLTQAEAVVDLIHARTERASRAASEQLAGGLSKVFDHIRDNLLQTLAHVEAYIDFPDEEISPDVGAGLRRHLLAAKGAIEDALATFREGHILRNGVRVAIVGRPNAGKSSLLNVLLKQSRAIVSEVPGTTRDTIEADADIGGVPFVFVDTAGLRDSENPIEMEGVRRSRQWIEKADLVLWVVDGSQAFSPEDEIFCAEFRNVAVPPLIVLNKSDLETIWKPLKDCKEKHLIKISCLSGEGITELRRILCKTALGCQSTASQGYATINSRHHEGLQCCRASIEESLRLLDKPEEPLELLAAELHIAVNAIGELLGKTTTEDLLDSIFSQFCIGK